MRSRRWLLVVSIGIHVVLVAVFVINGLWRLDRLDAGRLPGPSLAVMQPLDQAAGSAPAAVHAKPVHKPDRPTVTTIVQPTVKPPEDKPVVAALDPGDGSGSGSGSGSDQGSGSGSGSGSDRDPGCPLPPCGETHVVTIPPIVVVQPELVSPQVIAGLRVSGDTQVHPSELVQNEMLHDDRHKVVSTFKLCLTAGGDIASVKQVASTHYPDYDARLTDAVRGWRYKPYTVGGQAVPVCGVVTFVYTMQ